LAWPCRAIRTAISIGCARVLDKAEDHRTEGGKVSAIFYIFAQGICLDQRSFRILLVGYQLTTIDANTE
jgi:hypothetical protein